MGVRRSYFGACCSWKVPARLTWLLQPADTHVFAKFKAKLRSLWVEARSDMLPDQEMGFERWVGITCRTISDVLCGNPWRKAFRSNGLHSRQHLVSERVLAAIGNPAMDGISNLRPSVADLTVLFPKRTNVPQLCLFSPAPKAAAKAKPQAKPKAKAAAACFPISHFTRGKSKRMGV